MRLRRTDPKTGKHTLCEPARSKCLWTLHKSHFVLKFIGKMAAHTSTDIFLCEPAQSRWIWTVHKSFCVEIYRENAAGAGYHLD